MSLRKIFLHLMIIFHLTMSYLSVVNDGEHLWLYLFFAGYFILRLRNVEVM